jgi:hypothetical protein
MIRDMSRVPPERRWLPRRPRGGPRPQVRQRGVPRLSQEHAMMGSCLIVGSAYHTNTNAKVERANGVISDTLRAYADGPDALLHRPQRAPATSALAATR